MSRHQGFQKEVPSLFKFSQLLCDSAMNPAGRFFQTRDRKSQRRGEGIVSENVLRTAEELDGQGTQGESRRSCLVFLFIFWSFSFSLTRGALPCAIGIPSVQKSPRKMRGAGLTYARQAQQARGRGGGVGLTGCCRPDRQIPEGLAKLLRSREEGGRCPVLRPGPGSRDLGRG